MKTEIYLVRHSKTQKINIVNSSDTLQLRNEKSILSVDGEKLAEEVSKYHDFDNVDVVYSSSYTRAVATAKYIANRNNLDINIDQRFNERKHGVDSYNELPKDFEIKQFIDENFKMINGENRKEVTIRMYEALLDILNNYSSKKVVIVSHSTAIAFLLSKWCNINYSDSYTFKDKIFFDGVWNYCQTFKLEFEGKELKNIENITLFK